MLQFFFFNDTATTEIYTLSLHDALPICRLLRTEDRLPVEDAAARVSALENRLPLLQEVAHRRHLEEHESGLAAKDRKSTRLNSSHANISYAVFCLKKKQHNSSNTKSE